MVMYLVDVVNYMYMSNFYVYYCNNIVRNLVSQVRYLFDSILEMFNFRLGKPLLYILFDALLYWML